MRWCLIRCKVTNLNGNVRLTVRLTMLLMEDVNLTRWIDVM